MIRFFAALSVAAALLAAGCAPKPPNAPQAGAPDPLERDAGPDPARIISGVGTIVYVDLEGGFYGLIADDGTRYDPLNLDEAFEQDSLQVRFRAEEQTGVMTIRQWGRPVRILEMLRLD